MSLYRSRAVAAAEIGAALSFVMTTVPSTVRMSASVSTVMTSVAPVESLTVKADAESRRISGSAETMIASMDAATSSDAGISTVASGITDPQTEFGPSWQSPQ